MTESMSVLAACAAELGLTLTVVPGGHPVAVRRARRTVLVGSQPMDPDAAVRELEASYAAEDDHPGWEAVCPSCNRVYRRSAPARVQHQCGACRTPLRFA